MLEKKIPHLLMCQERVGANLVFALRTKAKNEPISKKQCIWVHGLPSPPDIGLISVSVRGRTQGSPLHWFRILVGFRLLRTTRKFIIAYL
jgi:hypothetical protein